MASNRTVIENVLWVYINRADVDLARLETRIKHALGNAYDSGRRDALIDAAPKWIPSEDSLPKPGEWVWVLFVNDKGVLTPCIDFIVAPEEKVYFVNWAAHDEEAVKYWQPISPIPEEVYENNK